MNLRMINLYLAVFWLFLAGTIFYFDYARGAPGWALPLGGGNALSVAWLAVFLAGYNVLRWFMTRSQERSRELAARRREESQRDRPRRPAGEGEPEYNPDFDFGRQPPPHP